MLAELTLKIEQPIIEKAQEYAYKQNINLSKVVGDYLQGLYINSIDMKEVSTEQPKKRQLGFMKGEINVPDDINWGDDKVLEEFNDAVTKKLGDSI